uniref:Glabrous enhancer-binding protein-like DBD domain-containing protein n=1 Tax=Oryza punctata TaxID=4537 RepID=A0A0E0JJG8_ORYPU
MAAKRVRDSPQIDNAAEVTEGSPPPVAAQSPRAPTRAAESEEEGGDSGKDDVAAPPKGSGSGNAAAPDGLAKSPMKPKKRVTALPLSDHGSRENLAKSPSNEVPTLQEDEAAQDDNPESPPKSKKNLKKKKKKALRAGHSGKDAAPDVPAEPTHTQQDVGEVDGRLAESEQEVPPNAGKAKKKASAQARKKPSAKQHAAQEEDDDLVVKTEEESAPQQGGEEDSKGSLPQRKSKRVAALSGNSQPDPKRTKIVDAQKPGFRRKWNGNDEIMILEALVDQIRSGENVPHEPGHPLFHELAQRLEGRTFNHNDVREKVRSLKRRYNDVVLSGLAITKDHDLQLHELSCEIWGRSVAHAGDKQRSLARDEQSSLDRDEQKSFSRDEEKSLASDEQRSFDEMCKQFPLLAKEIKVLVEGQPAIMELFPRLDGDQVVAIEKKLENLRWIDMKRKKKMAVKMAKIRKGLIYKLEELRS